MKRGSCFFIDLNVGNPKFIVQIGHWDSAFDKVSAQLPVIANPQ
jgi:hypothetical protein